MEHRLVDRPTALEVLHDDSLEEFRRYVVIPDPIRIDHDDRSTAANAQAGSFATLYASRTEEQSFALE